MMPSDKETLKATSKFAQLYTLFNQRREEKYFDSVLQDQVDINFQVPSNSFLKAHKSDIIGCTALHFAVEMDKIEIFHRLLNQGADFTIKNQNGSTALHRAIEDGSDERSGWKLNGKLDNSFVHPVLSHHILTHNSTNPSNKNGISHFHAACVTNQVDAVEFFLDNGIPINHTVNFDSPVFAGYTGLHFAARCCALEVMQVLLQREADVNVQNAKKMTALHVLIERNVEIIELINAGKDEVYENIAEDFDKNTSMMNLLINRNESKVDGVGLSYFHVACTMKDNSMVESFLEENVDINQVINVDSSVWPGFTPLHFAAIFNFNTVKLLLKKGADIEAKDAKGVTPFEMCLERYGFEEIHYILSNHEAWSNIVLSDCNTKLVDLVLAMRDLNQFESVLRNIDVHLENRLDLRIPNDSALWPGNTLLHLSVILYDVTKNISRIDPATDHLQLIDECLRLGSHVTMRNAQGFTPLHLAFRSGREDVVDRILQHHHSSENPIDAGGLCHLHIACAANDKFSVVNILTLSERDIDLGLRSSFKWYGTLRNMFGLSRRCIVHLNAGSTPLHIAVAIGSVEIAELLLKHGADLYAKDADGLTPIHRVLTSCDRTKIGRTLLAWAQPVRECITENGLSHLHIASFVNNVETMKKLLEAGTDVNVAVAGESSTYAKNISIDMCDNPFTFVSSMSITQNDGEEGGQISVTIDRDTRSGEAPVDPYGESAKYLNRYAGFTPLHFAMRGDGRDAVNLLVANGADILIRGNGLTPLYDTLNCVYNHLDVFVPILKANAAMRERVREDTGITMLHIACHKIDVDMVKDVLSHGDVDVNASTRPDSPVWPSHTALHVLMMRWERDLGNIANVPTGINDILQVLLDNGADVTQQNADLDTPLHVADRHLRGCDGDPVDSPARICVRLLLNKHADFNVNPVNSRGYSFFHMACRMNEVALVREYLSHGVDANRTIDFFSDERAGESPLILTAGSLAKRVVGIEKQLEVTDLLLKHDADIHAEDAFRNTPLHAAAGWGSFRENLLERLVSHGANMYAKNIFGDTPFERLLRSFRTTTTEIEVFLNHGFSVNSFNDISEEGYMSMLFSRRLDNVVQMSIFEAMVKSTNVAKVDDKGRTAIHNIVSNTHPIIADDDFVDLIEKLTEFGLDIDAKDETGKTALHTATKFRNYKAVSGLLKSGADLNILDSNLKPAFAYFLEPSDLDEDDDESVSELTIKAFVFHLQKLQLCGLEFSQLNGMIRDRAIEKYAFEFDFNVCFNSELEKTKNTKIGLRSLTLYDFLSETGAVAAYPTMTQLDRDAATEFFESTCKFSLHREFNELVGLLKLQYRKALKRLQLVEPAKAALLGLIPCILPDLCSEAILRFLSNDELTKLISIVLQVARARKRMRIQ